MELTKEEKAFLVEVISKLSVNPADKNAPLIVQTVQAILAKLVVE